MTRPTADIAHYRPAAGAVIFNADGQVWLGRRANETKAEIWQYPQGGIDPGEDADFAVIREVHEETGLTVTVGAPALVNEFHAPDRGFHQVDIYFRCTIAAGQIDKDWTDPEGIVTKRRFFSQSEMADIRFKPDGLPDVAWQTDNALAYDPLEPLVR